MNRREQRGHGALFGTRFGGSLTLDCLNFFAISCRIAGLVTGLVTGLSTSPVRGLGWPHP